MTEELIVTLKQSFYKIIENLLIKGKFFRKWYINKLSTDLYDLELTEEIMPRKEIYNKKLEEIKKLKKKK